MIISIALCAAADELPLGWEIAAKLRIRDSYVAKCYFAGMNCERCHEKAHSLWLITDCDRGFWMARKFASLTFGAAMLVVTVQGIGVGKAVESANPTTPQIVAGDDMAFALPETDIELSSLRNELPQGVFWIRIPLDQLRETGNGLAVSVELPAAYEVYWDGHLIGRSGIPSGDSHYERPGRLYSSFALRLSETGPGTHFLALRASNWRLTHPADQSIDIEIGSQRDAQQRLVTRSATTGAVSLVGFLVFVFFLWTGSRIKGRNANYIYALLALSSSLIVVLANWPWTIGLRYDLLFERQIALVVLTLAFYVCLSLALLLILKIERWVIVGTLLAIPPFIAFVPMGGLEHDARTFILLSLVSAGLAIRRRELGLPALVTGLVAAAVFISVVIDPEQLHLLLFAVTLIVAVRAAYEYRVASLAAARREAQASRLELELVKRSIQPHFLMNTLAATQELIETTPERASRFVEALAAEFRSLLGVTGRNLVELGEEIDLCVRYLTVMSYRYEAEYNLEVSGVASGIEVPPGILHTLIENAISHWADPRNVAVFRLEIAREGRHVQLRLAAPTGSPADTSPLSTGTGTAYIEARLREAFDNSWSLRTEDCQSEWVTIIDME